MRTYLPTLLLACLLPLVAQADRVYQYQDAEGNILFTNKDFVPHRFHLVSVRNYGWTFNPAPLTEEQRNRYDATIKQAANRYAVAPGLIKAIIHAESHFERNAVSSAGAQGLMQLMPATAESLQVDDVFDPSDNIMGGSRLLSILQKRFDSLDLVLAAYNAGSGNVMRYGGIPPFPETQRYVVKVKELLPRYKRQFQQEQLASR